MWRTDKNSMYRSWITAIALLWLCSLMAGCASDSYTAKGAARGATTGAVAGAVGGLISGLVFGGNALDRAARGAVYGGATGAAFGAMSGSEADRRAKEQQEARIERLRQEIGDDAFDGLAALAYCDYELSLRQAAKARQSENADYALAGLWLEIISYADQRDEARGRSLFPVLVEKDQDIKTEAQAEETMRQALNDLMDIRQEYKLPRVCQ